MLIIGTCVTKSVNSSRQTCVRYEERYSTGRLCLGWGSEATWMRRWRSKANRCRKQCLMKVLKTHAKGDVQGDCNKSKERHDPWSRRNWRCFSVTELSEVTRGTNMCSEDGIHPVGRQAIMKQEITRILQRASADRNHHQPNSHRRGCKNLRTTRTHWHRWGVKMSSNETSRPRWSPQRHTNDV